MSVLDNIGLPNNKTRVDYSNGSNGDIINTIHKNFAAAVRETKDVANSFRGKNNLETAYKIWTFLRTKIKYKVDGGGVQQIRLPKRFLNTKVGDCKSFSLFTAGILRNLGMPVTFRYASYSVSPTPGHVYVVTKDEAGNDIIIDGVWSRFDDEKTPNYKPTDYNMRIETLSGLGSIGAKKAKKEKKPKKKIKDIFKDVVGKVKSTFPLLVLGRNAFLGLVRLNVRGFATRTAASIAKDSANAKNVWTQKLGGDYGSLTSAVNAGKTKKAIFPKKIGDLIEGIGEPISTAAAIAAAAPVILIVINQILKKTGHGNDAIMDESITEANEGIETEVSEDDVEEINKNGLPKPPGKLGFSWDVDVFSFDWWARAAWWSTLIGTGLTQTFSNLF